MYFLISSGMHYINAIALCALLFTINTPTLNASFTSIAFAKIKLLPVTGIVSFALGAADGFKKNDEENDSDAALGTAKHATGPVGIIMTVSQAPVEILINRHVRGEGRGRDTNAQDLKKIANFPWLLRTYGTNATGYIIGCCCHELYKKTPIKQICAAHPKLALGFLAATTASMAALGIHCAPA